MDIFIVDAFTSEMFKGNQAGVVILSETEDYQSEIFMINLASELKHSETAFVKKIKENEFKIRYFTPVSEVDLCGHATISSFSVLREHGYIDEGDYIIDTLAGRLNVEVKKDLVWMDMATPKTMYEFKGEEINELYEAFDLSEIDKANSLRPMIADTGLRDIMLPVKDRKTLDFAFMNRDLVVDISKRYDVTGFHLFCLGDDRITAYCRDFAPLVGIDEESATGTANGALTYYLKEYGLIKEGVINTFIQGEKMNRKSVIKTMIDENKIKVGGSAKSVLKCELLK